MVQLRQTYEAAFKEDALNVLRDTNRSIRQVAEDQGISAGTLRGWVRADVKKTKIEGRTEVANALLASNRRRARISN